MKTCKVCKEEFSAYRPQDKYCGKECRLAWGRKNRKPMTTEQRARRRAYKKQYDQRPHVKQKQREAMKERYWKDPEKYRKVARLESLTQEQIEKKRIANREYMRKNGRKNYYANHEENKRKLRNYVNKRLKTDVQFALNSRFRCLMNQHLRYLGIPKHGRTYEGLDYTPEELKEHLESRFTNGMSWDNMSDWHIDHIRPVSSFNYTTTECEDFKKCWALENLQPLWAADNICKGNKWDGEVNA